MAHASATPQLIRRCAESTGLLHDTALAFENYPADSLAVLRTGTGRNDDILTDVGEIADYNVRLLRERRPEGPYRLPAERLDRQVKTFIPTLG